MSIKYYTAHKIHSGTCWMSAGTILAFDELNTLVKIYSNATELPLDASVQHIEGTLLPGMVNVHCHLELSHTKGTIEEGTGLVDFLIGVMQQRNQLSEDDKKSHIQSAIDRLVNTGCIAVGDISNSTDLVPFRPNAPLHFVTFVETMGCNPAMVEGRFNYAQKVKESFQSQSQSSKGYSLQQHIVPHAPYSVIPELFKLIDISDPTSLISIHNEETAAENEYSRFKTGEMTRLYEFLKIDEAVFEPTGNTSLANYLPLLNSSHPLLLIHNTMMEASDIVMLQNSNHPLISLGLCPNANWYIERKLPNIPQLINSGINICIGTDSLASNKDLNIWSEICTINKHFPDISEEELIKWATFNGAKALGLTDKIGTFSKGKKPGLVVLKNNSTKRLF